jgi:predicted nucleotidyltransferase
MDPMNKDRHVDQLLETLRSVKPDLEARYQVEQLAVFGSVVKGDTRPDSDLDILVSFREPPSLLQFVQLENELSDRLGVKVDLVMREALKPRIGERILEEIVPV